MQWKWYDEIERNAMTKNHMQCREDIKIMHDWMKDLNDWNGLEGHQMKWHDMTWHEMKLDEIKLDGMEWKETECREMKWN